MHLAPQLSFTGPLHFLMHPSLVRASIGVLPPNTGSMNTSTTTITRFTLALGLAVWSLSAQATGLATCDSGDRSKWMPTDKLESQLKARGWTVRRIKEDGGCYEVYALTDKGERVEAYFHPLTLDPVPTKAR